MSDSQLNENKTDKSGTKKVISDPVKSSSLIPKNGLSKPVYFLIAALILGLAWFGFIILQELFANGSKSKNNVSLSEGSTSNEPVSILPRAPAGITILEKQAELENTTPSPQINVTSGASIGNKHALVLGKALSFAELSEQFAQIVITNGPDNFQKLEPRALLTETVNGLEALLLVGPFESEKLALEACEVLILPPQLTVDGTQVGTNCKTSVFEGELIARE
ncbi:MAG: hypothetical protein AB8B49_06725 [Nitratireductor sp.]